jgi:hypothetical protein
MTYRGHVENGSVVFDETVVLPEGAAVQVDVLGVEGEAEEAGTTLYEQLAPLVGAAKGLPPDLARNHDHYLHGQARK